MRSFWRDLFWSGLLFLGMIMVLVGAASCVAWLIKSPGGIPLP
jgi:hypothetical protein